MTPTQLTTKLRALLSDLLGTYTVKGVTGTTPAIREDDPPTGWDAYGLEVIVYRNPEYVNEALHARTAVATEIPVRVISRGGSNAAAAVTRICQAFDATNPTTIPGNERLGILTQYTLRVRT